MLDSYFTFSKDLLVFLRDGIGSFSTRALFGYLLGCALSQGWIKDWIYTDFSNRPRLIDDIRLLGGDIFMVMLSSIQYPSSLVDSSPFSLSGKLIYLVLWYRGFDATRFEDRCQAPRFSLTLSFHGLLLEILVPVVLEQLASIVGVPQVSVLLAVTYSIH